MPWESKTVEEIRKEFNVENKKVIGHLGRFMTQKNHFFIIDIFDCLGYLSIAIQILRIIS